MINYLADVLASETGLTNRPLQTIQSNKLLIVESLVEIDKDILYSVYDFIENNHKITNKLCNELQRRFEVESKNFID